MEGLTTSGVVEDGADDQKGSLDVYVGDARGPQE